MTVRVTIWLCRSVWGLRVSCRSCRNSIKLIWRARRSYQWLMTIWRRSQNYSFNKHHLLQDSASYRTSSPRVIRSATASPPTFKAAFLAAKSPTSLQLKYFRMRPRRRVIRWKIGVRGGRRRTYSRTLGMTRATQLVASSAPAVFETSWKNWCAWSRVSVTGRAIFGMMCTLEAMVCRP